MTAATAGPAAGVRVPPPASGSVPGLVAPSAGSRQRPIPPPEPLEGSMDMPQATTAVTAGPPVLRALARASTPVLPVTEAQAIPPPEPFQVVLPQMPENLTPEEQRKHQALYVTTLQASHALRDKFGMMGILEAVRMSDPHLNMLALGMDPTGSNETPPRREPEFYVPRSYFVNPPKPKLEHFSKFSLETLFYMFYSMPRDMQQALAAWQLYERGWLYHKTEQMWIAAQPQDDGAGNLRLVYYDPIAWKLKYVLKEVDPSGFLTKAICGSTHQTPEPCSSALER
ncbi:VIP2 [Symbiodinium sp. CCMP2592]|nr:VIP2 [Symbiodinium sp. CCMP2592]